MGGSHKKYPPSRGGSPKCLGGSHYPPWTTPQNGGESTKMGGSLGGSHNFQNSSDYPPKWGGVSGGVRFLDRIDTRVISRGARKTTEIPLLPLEMSKILRASHEKSSKSPLFALRILLKNLCTSRKFWFSIQVQIVSFYHSPAKCELFGSTKINLQCFLRFFCDISRVNRDFRTFPREARSFFFYSEGKLEGFYARSA